MPGLFDGYKQLTEGRPGTCYLSREWQGVSNGLCGGTGKDLTKDCRQRDHLKTLAAWVINLLLILP